MSAAQFLTLTLGGELFALPLLEARQIVEHVEPTRVPHLPALVLGVVNLRGTVAPVVDLCVKLGLQRPPLSRSTCIVLVDAPELGQLGLLADSVEDVIEVAADEILPVPDFGTPVDGDYLHGLIKVDGRLALLLDTARLLSLAELLAVAASPLATAPALATA